MSAHVAVQKAIRKVVALGSPERLGSISLPRSGLLAYYRGGTDTIGLSVSDYDSVSAELQAIFFSAGPTLRSAEDILTDAFASEYLNVDYMIGNESRGILLLYEDGTDEAILARARRYAGVVIADALLIGGDTVTIGGETAVF